MRYVICNKTLAVDHGFTQQTHRCKGTQMILNEREVMLSPSLAGASLEVRIECMDGCIKTESEIIGNIKNGDWQ